MRFASLSPWLVLLSVTVNVRAQEPTSPPPTENSPPPPPSQLEAGGLKPPEAVASEPEVPSTPADADVQRELEKADEEDTGRGLEFVWLNAEAGYQIVSLEALGGDTLIDGELFEPSQNGLVYGAAAGVRLFVITVGARFRYGAFSDWKPWSLFAEGALRVPLGDLEVYAGIGAGYVSIGSFESDAELTLDVSELRASGIGARLGGGVDYYLSNTFSLGANLSGDLLVLRRDAVAAGDMPTPPESFYASEGSSTGAAFTATAVLGLHF